MQSNSAQKSQGSAKIINVILSVLIVLLVIIIVLLLFVITPFSVSGSSMSPTFETGDKVLVLKVGYNLNRGDIVVFDREGSPDPPVKRIIGLPGDVVRFDTAQRAYYVNGEKHDNYAPQGGYPADYLATSDHAVVAALTGDGLVVGEDECYLLGDNRTNSKDSHDYGCIALSAIKGKVILKY